MINFFRWVTRWMFLVILVGGIALTGVALIGGLFFNLEGSTVFTWFALILLIAFIFFLILAIGGILVASFLLGRWLFRLLFVRPAVFFILLGTLVLLFVVVRLFITPSDLPVFDLGEVVKPALDFLNKK